MPAKPDFQPLVDWCTQPAASPWLRHTVGISLNWRYEDYSPRAWSGTLAYIPPRASRWFPEHFSGVLRRTTSGLATNFVFAVGDNYAVVGMGAYVEYDVSEVDQDDPGAGIIAAYWQGKPDNFGLYSAYLFNTVSWEEEIA